MNRTFISLYIVIVGSVLSLGWLTEQVWQAFSSSPNISQERKDLMRLLSASIDKPDAESAAQALSVLQSHIENRLMIYRWDDFAASAAKDSLQAGAVMAISQGDNSSIYYQRSPSGRFIVGFVETATEASERWLYRFLLMSFYLLVGISIYFWVLPLTRDLKRLQDNAEKVGRDGEMEALSLKPNSAIYGLAQTFNEMAARIRGLLASQREMTHGISHELRTPLARMKFTLASIDDAVREHAHVDELNDNIVEMERLIVQFLNYASFEAKKGHVEFREGELQPMIERIVKHSDFHLHVSVVNGLTTGYVQCEWDLLEHCVKNVLQNAARYAKSTICVRLTESDSHYQISIEDDGPGVPDEDRHRIFQAFYRSGNHAGADPSYDQGEKKSFGLGLALVRRIMQWHRGEVTVHNASLGGAKFLLSWNKNER